MPPLSTVDLSYLSGPAPGLAVTGLTGAGATKNLTYTLQAALAFGKYQWANGTNTIAAAANGDWLVSSGATVLYRMTGSKDWPWSAGTWAGENSGTGTPAFAWKTITPVRSGLIEEDPQYVGDTPGRIGSLDPNSGAPWEDAEITCGTGDGQFIIFSNDAGKKFNALSVEVLAAVAGSVDTTVTFSNMEIVITPGAKGTMIVANASRMSGPLLPDSSTSGVRRRWTPEGYTQAYWEGGFAHAYLEWSLGVWYAIAKNSSNVIVYQATCTSNALTPDGLTFGAPTVGIGTATVTAAASSTPSVEACFALNAELVELVTFQRAGQKSIATMAKTHLSGGTGGPPYPVSIAI